jgi:hypothetical protein
LVDSYHFINLAKVLDPRIQLPCRSTLKKVLLPDLYKEAKRNLQSEIDSFNHVHFTADGWTSITGVCLLFKVFSAFYCFHRLSELFRNYIAKILLLMGRVAWTITIIVFNLHTLHTLFSYFFIIGNAAYLKYR